MPKVKISITTEDGTLLEFETFEGDPGETPEHFASVLLEYLKKRFCLEGEES